MGRLQCIVKVTLSRTSLSTVLEYPLWVDGSGVGRLQTNCESDLITYLFKRSDRIIFVGEESGG